jgi:hypothetical protein
MLANPKKKRKVEASPVPVVASPESVLLLLKRVLPTLRNSSSDDEEDEAVTEDSTSESNYKVTKVAKEQKRKHSRVNKPWSRGRSWLAIGVNECTRVFGE